MLVTILEKQVGDQQKKTAHVASVDEISQWLNELLIPSEHHISIRGYAALTIKGSPTFRGGVWFEGYDDVVYSRRSEAYAALLDEVKGPSQMRFICVTAGEWQHWCYVLFPMTIYQ